MQGWGRRGIALRPAQTGWLGCSLTRLYTIALGIFRVHQKVGNIFQLKRKTTAEKQNQTEPNRTEHSADSVLGGEGSSVRRSDRHEIISNVADDKS